MLGLCPTRKHDENPPARSSKNVPGCARSEAGAAAAISEQPTGPRATALHCRPSKPVNTKTLHCITIGADDVSYPLLCQHNSVKMIGTRSHVCIFHTDESADARDTQLAPEGPNSNASILTAQCVARATLFTHGLNEQANQGKNESKDSGGPPAPVLSCSRAGSAPTFIFPAQSGSHRGSRALTRAADSELLRTTPCAPYIPPRLQQC